MLGELDVEMMDYNKVCWVSRFAGKYINWSTNGASVQREYWKVNDLVTEA